MQLKSSRILVIGDVMLDKYGIGSVQRISPEAPVPVLKKERERMSLGGAANVAANLSAAGQNAALFAFIGDDSAGVGILKMLENAGVDASLVQKWDRPTIMKTRFITDSNQQILRLDVEESSPISEGEMRKPVSDLVARIGEFDLIILSDYMKGLLTPVFTQEVIHIARKLEIPVFVDVKDTQRAKYIGATLLKPNRKELGDLTGMPTSNRTEVVSAAFELCNACECDYVLATCGSRGMVLVDAAGKSDFVPATSHEVFDVSGAGDTAIAYLAASFSSGYSIAEAMGIANAASGIQVTKAGASPVFSGEVEAALGVRQARTLGTAQILERDRVAELRNDNPSKKIVFTNGCFDILHAGHVDYLQKAATLGDILVVGVNDDDSVRRLKGVGRPINALDDRISVLGALASVDYVVAFNEDTPHNLITALRPDVLVKGGDYSVEEIVGHEIVKARGGKVLSLPFVEGKSSSLIIARILENEAPGKGRS